MTRADTLLRAKSTKTSGRLNSENPGGAPENYGASTASVAQRIAFDLASHLPYM